MTRSYKVTVEFDWDPDPEVLPENPTTQQVQKAFVEALQLEAYDNGWMRGTFEVKEVKLP